MLEIQLIGIGCTRSRRLRERLLATLAFMPVGSYRLEEVTDVKDIISLAIKATPALLINGVVAVEGEVPNRKELARLLGAYAPAEPAARGISV